MSIRPLVASFLLLISTIAIAQEDLDVDLTGSWFTPEINGSGFLIDDAPETLVVYWFTYGANHISSGEQVWFIAPYNPETGLLDIYRPSGSWMASEYELGDPVGSMALDPIDDNTALLSFRFFDFGTCQPVMVSPVWAWCGGELEVTRLTRRTEEE